jgi:phosphotransferase system IIA component
MTGVDRAETVTSSKQTVVTAAVEKKYITFEAIVSTDDTITLGDFTTVLGAALLKKADGSAITCTVATNVLTVTQATTTNVPIVGFAYGT